MSREIRFRLRDRHNKIVGYEKWYCGKFRKDEGAGFSPDSGYWEASPCWLYSKDGKNWNPTPINHRFKDQFTEFTDMAGTGIYENDNLSLDCDCEKPCDRHISKVVFSKGSFYCGDEFLNDVANEGEIIRPELLDN